MRSQTRLLCNNGITQVLPATPTRTVVCLYPQSQDNRPLTGTKLYCLVTEAHRCEKPMINSECLWPGSQKHTVLNNWAEIITDYAVTKVVSDCVEKMICLFISDMPGVWVGHTQNCLNAPRKLVFMY